MKMRLTAFALAVALLLGACSGSSGSETSPAEEKGQNKIVVGIVQDFDSLDPHISDATGTQEVMFNIFHGLVNVTPGSEIVPELCESFEVSPDLMTYTYHLRQDVKFHGGTPMTAKDVAYSFHRLMGRTEDQTEPLRQTMVEAIASIETPDDYTVIFHMNLPSAGFISSSMYAIIPEGSGPTQATNPVGTGPFKFVSYTPGIGITMERFDDYYGEAPALESADFKIFTDANAGQLALQNEEIHVMTSVTGSNISYDESKIKLLSVPSNTVQLLGLNHEFEPFQNLQVRQAICHAINKEDIIKAVSPNAQKIDTGFCPVMSFYYNGETEGYYEYDPQRARELLADAGYSDLSFTIRVATEYKANTDAAMIIQQNLQDIGVKVELDTIEWNTWLQEVYTDRKHEATVVGFTGKIDPHPILNRYTSDYYRNFINYKNPEYDKILVEATATGDQNVRAELYKSAQMILTQDAVSVFTMDPSNNILMAKNLEGYQTYPLNYIDLRSIYFAS